MTSTKAHARILNIDISKAENCPGFVRFFSAKDVSGENHLGPIIHDEEVFASIEVKHYAAASFSIFPLVCLTFLSTIDHRIGGGSI